MLSTFFDLSCPVIISIIFGKVDLLFSIYFAYLWDKNSFDKYLSLVLFPHTIENNAILSFGTHHGIRLNQMRVALFVGLSSNCSHYFTRLSKPPSKYWLMNVDERRCCRSLLISLALDH